MTVTLVLIGYLLAFAAPTARVSVDPRANDVILNEFPVRTGSGVPVDLGMPFDVHARPGSGWVVTGASINLRLAGIDIARSTARASDGGLVLNLSGRRLLVAGPVRGHLVAEGRSRPPLTTELLLVPQGRWWFTTIPGVAIVGAVLFVAAYTESLLRPIRRRRQARLSEILGMSLIGLVAGAALVGAAWAIGERLLPPVSVVAILTALAGAGALLPLLVARRGSGRAAGTRR